MFKSLASCAWEILFSFSVAANIFVFMVWFYTKLWYMMSSKKFNLTIQQKRAIAGRVRETIEKSPWQNIHRYAEHIGVPENTVHNWAAKDTVKLGFLLAFSNEFNLTLDWLIKGKTGKPSDTE